MFALATNAAPGQPNEDATLTTPDLIIVVDGTDGLTDSCSHGAGWYTRQLAAQTMVALMSDPHIALTEGLGRGIHSVARLHVYTCDLDSGSTPSAAVGILRIGDDEIETLSLANCTVLVETPDGPQITADRRAEESTRAESAALAGLAIGTPEHMVALDRIVQKRAAARDRDGGWWVASSDPQAAYQALTKSYPRSALRRAAAFTDGATRPVDEMGLYSWPEYLDLLNRIGPAGLIEHVREIERADPDGDRHPRATVHDDATAVYMPVPPN